MKKSLLGVLGISMFLGMGVLTSCEDEFTEEDALQRQEELLDKQQEQAIALENLTQEQKLAYLQAQDSLERIGGVIVYTVRVMSGGGVNTTNARAAVASGAEVTVVQNGVSITEAADENGLVTFSDMRIGQVNVTVKAEDHTTAFFTSDITPSSGSYNTPRNASTTVPLFPTTEDAGAGKIVGKVEVETNLLNDEPEVAVGAKVTASIDLSNSTFHDNFLLNEGAGRITSISYENATVSATVGDDGTYELIVPAGIGNGNEGLPLALSFGNFSAQQILVENGVVDTVNADFIPSGSSSTVPSDAGLIIEMPEPSTPGTGLEFSVTPIPTELEDYDNFDVEVLSGGAGYLGGNSGYVHLAIEGADSTFAVFEVEDGKITNYDGLAYTDPFVTSDEVFTETPSLGALVDHDAGTTDDTEAPSSAATFKVKFQKDYDIQLTNSGSGYTFIPELRVKYSYYDDMDISSGGGDDSDFSQYTEYDTWEIGAIEGLQIVDGSIFLVNDAQLPDASDIVYEDFMTSFEIVEVVTRERRAAELIPTINSNGELTSITVIDGGEGYTPGQRIELTLTTPNGMGTGASAFIAEEDIDTDDGEIDDVTIVSRGSGYTTTANQASQDNADNKSRTVNLSAGESVKVNFDYGTGTRD